MTPLVSRLDPPVFSKAKGISLSPAACAQGEVCRGLEWLLADGHSGYSTGSVSLTPTRRYHGLLVLPLPPERRRYVLLGHLGETVCVNGESWDLGQVDLADGADSTDGAKKKPVLRSFHLMPWPTWEYRLNTAKGEVRLRREVLLDGQHQQVTVRWSVAEGGREVELRVAPYLPYREADDLTFANDVLDGSTATVPVEGWELGIETRPYTSLPALRLAFNAGSTAWTEEPHWLRGIILSTDLARGYGGHEDRFSPGIATLRIDAGGQAFFSAGISPGGSESAEACWRRLSAKAEARWAKASQGRLPAQALLWRGADDFLARSPLTHGDVNGPQSRLGILAGFPWFGEWGRDVFLSLPGLTIARGDLDTCSEVLRGALPFLRNGLLPNIYGATPELSHYGSVDASLWFARAARLYRQAGGDLELCLGPLRNALAEIRSTYAAGTNLGIRGDSGGLVQAGGPDLNPTWMDAQTSKGPVTPRAGCPVEIAALWILLLAELLELETDRAQRAELEAALKLANAAFRKRFWMEKEGQLADLWTEDGQDRSLRPNAVLAAAMDTTPLNNSERKRLLARVDDELLTDVGLRTLSPRDPAYVPHYRGGTDERDGAYHQGTVWPWLLGSYVELCLLARGATGKETKRLDALFVGVERELLRAGLGHVSEVFDGDTPRQPGGTMAQAWNTAELLRARALLASGRGRA